MRVLILYPPLDLLEMRTEGLKYPSVVVVVLKVKSESDDHPGGSEVVRDE